MANVRVPLDERIKQIRAEVDALIDKRVKQIAQECPGVPSRVLRQTIVGDAAGCQCNAFLSLSEKRAL